MRALRRRSVSTHFGFPSTRSIRQIQRLVSPGDSGTIPNVYSEMADQIVALSMAAQATTRLKVATGICLVAEHNPIGLAKRLATLDLFSDGRLIVGVGAGWLREEAALFGVDFERR